MGAGSRFKQNYYGPLQQGHLRFTPVTSASRISLHNSLSVSYPRSHLSLQPFMTARNRKAHDENYRQLECIFDLGDAFSTLALLRSRICGNSLACRTPGYMSKEAIETPLGRNDARRLPSAKVSKTWAECDQ
ncbi:unnamed protein product [Rhizoctonia solani]|uniref:Uncharacterized protein n=1 Tax=Rhizoctonia solani TaxID=456999 RepID=A0A8H3HZQ1_9AGAM|nr:unnamed protein product [Rhizoctonia solani]